MTYRYCKSSRLEVFCNEAVIENFAKVTRKHLLAGLQLTARDDAEILQN